MNSETLIVKRSEWERGTGDGNLYNEVTKCGCILGLYLIKHGADPEDLATYQRPYHYLEEYGEISTPIDLIVDNEDFVREDEENEERPYVDSDWAYRSMCLNDDPKIQSDELREILLIEHFTKEHCELRFVD